MGDFSEPVLSLDFVHGMYRVHTPSMIETVNIIPIDARQRTVLTKVNTD